ncbi:MAG TPA: hypothetical protein VFD92_05075 [Candidatus Binatia bacterium]|nr:hypothetical protein [Candidatus Binatia bacterium]
MTISGSTAEAPLRPVATPATGIHPTPAATPASDAALCDAVADRIARPKIAEADSFVLHAPLELLARCALLPLVAPGERERARRRLARLGEAYDAWGPAIDDPLPRPWPTAEAAAADLVRAIDAGDLEAADAAAAWLADATTAEELARALADDVLPRLAAAAHGAIFLYQLPRVAARSRSAARGLRGLVRELAREREWRLGWQRERSRDGRATDDLVERLLCPPSPGDPGSSFIIPTMSLVERSGLARELLDEPTRAISVPEASRRLARVAAWSMLQDDPNHAPYGWTHCLSMSQAALGIADRSSDPRAAIAIAATYVLGFRATLGRVALDPGWEPEPPTDDDPLAALDGSPSDAAAAVWHAPAAAVPAIVAGVATRAALHHDAHLAKYAVACFDAARADRAAGRLYLAAAAFLCAWWAEQPGDGLRDE